MDFTKRERATVWVLVAMGALAVGFLAVVLLQTRHSMHELIDRTAEKDAQLLVKSNQAIRDYVGRYIRPEMEKHVAPGEFIPETMSTTFVARSVFDQVRHDFPESAVRFASTNPRNPANQATAAERELIRYFEQHPEDDTWSGKMQLFDDGETYYVSARPRRFRDECLRCHGRPEDAPADLVARYGAERGFGRRVGDVTVELGAIPVSSAYAVASGHVWRHMLAAVGLCALFLLGIGVLIWIDIVRRRRFEQGLRESERRFIDVMYASDDAITLLDEHRFVECNEAVLRMLGMSSRDQLLGKTPAEVSPEYQDDGTPSAEKAEVEIQTAFEKGFHRFEWTHCRANGQLFPVEVSLSPTVYHGKRLLCAVWRDLTESKRMEAALQESEEKYRLLFEHAISGVAIQEMVFDDVGRPVDYVFLNVNPAFETQTGLRADDLIGRRVTEVFPDLDEAPFIKPFGRVVQTGEPVSFERYLPALKRYVAINAFCVGQRRFATVLRNVSDRKENERRIKESEAQLRAITDSARDAIVMIDSHGVITFWNAAAETIFGYPPEEALGRDVHELLSPERFLSDSRAGFPEFVRTGCGNAIGKTLEMAARHKRGHEIPIELSLAALRREGDWNAVAVVRDISERKKTDEALRASEEELKRTVAALESANKTLLELYQIAESATQAKSEFLANMSHEIRTPMTAILGFADLLLDEPGIDRAPPERIEAIKTIQRNGQYLLDLINDILDLSKIEAGKLDVEHVACSPEALLQEVVSLMQVRAEAKGLPLRLEFDGPLPEWISCDPFRLRQILINLVGNAIKFTERGSVRVVARSVYRQEHLDLLQVDVIDTGIGLSADQIDKLFKPFSQADTSMARKHGGTGLGLAISQRLAEMLGGQISVESEPGRGSTFSLTVETGDVVGLVDKSAEGSSKSAAQGAHEPAGKAENGDARLDGCRILLAEDGPDNQRLIALLLKRAGAEVHIAENGQEAYTQAHAAHTEGKPFDVILMDMQMPEMDGYEATRRLRSEGYSAPIIALTAHAMDGDEEKCCDAGCNGYLTKPIDHATFLPAIVRMTPTTPDRATSRSSR